MDQASQRQGSPTQEVISEISSDFRFPLFSFDPQEKLYETHQEYFHELQFFFPPEHECHVISLKKSVSQTNFSDKI